MGPASVPAEYQHAAGLLAEILSRCNSCPSSLTLISCAHLPYHSHPTRVSRARERSFAGPASLLSDLLQILAPRILQGLPKILESTKDFRVGRCDIMKE